MDVEYVARSEGRVVHLKELHPGTKCPCSVVLADLRYTDAAMSSDNSSNKIRCFHLKKARFDALHALGTAGRVHPSEDERVHKVDARCAELCIPSFSDRVYRVLPTVLSPSGTA